MIQVALDGRARFRTAQPASGTTQTLTLTQLNVANPDESDVDFILHAFDSALPYLASIGSEAQWGTTPFSEKPKMRQAFADYVSESYQLNAHSDTPSKDKTGGWQHLTLYEVKSDHTDQWTRVAAQGVSTSFPDYVPETLASNEIRAATDYVYLNYLIVDRRTGELAKGVGTHLVTFAQKQAKVLGNKIFYGDCWRGNNDRLIKYYQKLGFEPVGPFDVKDKHGPGLPWTGYLFQQTL